MMYCTNMNWPHFLNKGMNLPLSSTSVAKSRILLHMAMVERVVQVVWVILASSRSDSEPM